MVGGKVQEHQQHRKRLTGKTRPSQQFVHIPTQRLRCQTHVPNCGGLATGQAAAATCGRGRPPALRQLSTDELLAAPNSSRLLPFHVASRRAAAIPRCLKPVSADFPTLAAGSQCSGAEVSYVAMPLDACSDASSLNGDNLLCQSNRSGFEDKDAALLTEPQVSCLSPPVCQVSCHGPQDPNHEETLLPQVFAGQYKLLGTMARDLHARCNLPPRYAALASLRADCEVELKVGFSHVHAHYLQKERDVYFSLGVVFTDCMNPNPAKWPLFQCLMDCNINCPMPYMVLTAGPPPLIAQSLHRDAPFDWLPLIWQLLQALARLHSFGIYHWSVDTAHVLWNRTNKHLFLTDFSSSVAGTCPVSLSDALHLQRSEKWQPFCAPDVCGPHGLLTPHDLCDCLDRLDSVRRASLDVWAAGATMWFAFSGFTLFQGILNTAHSLYAADYKALCARCAPPQTSWVLHAGLQQDPRPVKVHDLQHVWLSPFGGRLEQDSRACTGCPWAAHPVWAQQLLLLLCHPEPGRRMQLQSRVRPCILLNYIAHQLSKHMDVPVPVTDALKRAMNLD